MPLKLTQTLKGRDAVKPGMCEHMATMIVERGYERDPKSGLLLVKTCKAPAKSLPSTVLRDTCGHTSPVSQSHCYNCQGMEFDLAPRNIIELDTCHRRCKTCRKVTPGCDVTTCAYCGSTMLTLLPPAINRDVYGLDIYIAPPASTASVIETLRKAGFHHIADRLKEF